MLLAAGLLLAACTRSEPIRLGFLGSLTGRSSDLAEAARNGAMLAIEQRNLAGGVHGRTIELTVRDDAENPDVAAKAAAELSASGVKAIIGPIMFASVILKVRAALSATPTASTSNSSAMIK